MMTQRWWQSILVAVLLVALVTPAVLAQQNPAPGVTVQMTVTVDNQGNTVIVERTFSNGVLIKEEEKVVTPQGQLIRKVERTFVGGQLVKLETLIRLNGTTTIVEQTFQNGQLVKEERKVLNAQGQVQLEVEMVFDPATGQVVRVKEESITTQNGTTVKTEREFRLVNGVLTEVAREVETVAIVNGQQVQIKQEFELRNGGLVMVEEEREVKATADPGGAKERDRKRDDKEKEPKHDDD
jgi:hypothetical protein